jgi:hypothetical protein
MGGSTKGVKEEKKRKEKNGDGKMIQSTEYSQQTMN